VSEIYFNDTLTAERIYGQIGTYGTLRLPTDFTPQS